MRDADVGKVSANQLLKLRPRQHPRLVLENSEVERGSINSSSIFKVQRQRCQEGKSGA